MTRVTICEVSAVMKLMPLWCFNSFIFKILIVLLPGINSVLAFWYWIVVSCNSSFFVFLLGRGFYVYL